MISTCPGCRLMMPRSGKGNPSTTRAQDAEERSRCRPRRGWRSGWPEQARGRGRHERLLLKSDGKPWPDDPAYEYRTAVAEVVASLGLDKGVTIYALRHTYATRSCRGHAERRGGASDGHSESVIRRHYGKISPITPTPSPAGAYSTSDHRGYPTRATSWQWRERRHSPRCLSFEIFAWIVLQSCARRDDECPPVSMHVYGCHRPKRRGGFAI